MLNDICPYCNECIALRQGTGFLSSNWAIALWLVGQIKLSCYQGTQSCPAVLLSQPSAWLVQHTEA